MERHSKFMDWKTVFFKWIYSLNWSSLFYRNKEADLQIYIEM